HGGSLLGNVPMPAVPARAQCACAGDSSLYLPLSHCREGGNGRGAALVAGRIPLRAARGVAPGEAIEETGCMNSSTRLALLTLGLLALVILAQWFLPPRVATV